MSGIFELKTFEDLYSKLKRDYLAFEQDQLNSDLAFNFFVTAWHLLEWVYPGDCTAQKSARDSNIILQICEHLAVGAKHFNPTSRKHKSVKNSDISGGAWAKKAWAPGVWKKGVWGEKLVVYLDGDASNEFGNQAYAIDLAKAALEFWKSIENT